MENFILTHEPVLRLSGFLGLLCLMGVWEWALPRRARHYSQARRWLTNIGLSLFNSVLLRFLVPVLAVGAAARAQENGFGLFNLVDLPVYLEWALAFLLLDLLIYGQHALFHHVPLFWRLHKVHHADPEIDTSTGVRFHPVEILLSMAIKLAAVTALGAAPVAVILFEIVLNATSLFNHGNVRLAPRVDRWVRRVFVTPDMHRVHHSVRMQETNSNFGFNLSVWDRLFGTYRAQPEDGHLGMTIGLSDHQNPAPTGFFWSLGLPFGAGRGKEHP
ncbi:MAG: sterol desaturase family protein [Parvibaculum sp.]